MPTMIGKPAGRSPRRGPAPGGRKSGTKAWIWAAAAALVIAFLLGMAITRRHGPFLSAVEDRLHLLPRVPGDTRSIAELTAAVRSPDPEVQREALRSLGRHLDHGTLHAAEVTPLLLEGVRAQDPGGRAVAASYLSLAQVDPDASAPTLVSLVDDPDALVRMNAVSGLTGLLERHSAAEGRGPRKLALPNDRTMSKADVASAIAALVRAWNDPNPDVRHWASKALVYQPEIRYDVPAEWRGLSRDQALERLHGLGLLPTGEALFEAVKEDDVAGVFTLLEAGVDPNTRSDMPARHAPLFTIGTATRPEITRLLLDAGADVRQKDARGRTAWDWIHETWERKPVWAPFGDLSLQMMRDAGAGSS